MFDILHHIKENTTAIQRIKLDNIYKIKNKSTDKFIKWLVRHIYFNRIIPCDQNLDIAVPPNMEKP